MLKEPHEICIKRMSTQPMEKDISCDGCGGEGNDRGRWWRSALNIGPSQCKPMKGFSQGMNNQIYL